MPSSSSKLDMTTTVLIVAGVVVLLYLIYGKNLPIFNTGNLSAESVAEDFTVEGYNASSASTDSSNTGFSESLLSKMKGINSNNSSTPRVFSLDQGSRGGASQGGLHEYFGNSLLAGQPASSGFSPMEADANSNQVNGNYVSANGSGSAPAAFAGDGKKHNMYDADELLPKDDNNGWFDIYNNIRVKNSNLINIFRPVGTNTVMGSNRNSSRDFRGEPSNPRFDVGPWNNSTIDNNVYNIGLCK